MARNRLNGSSETAPDASASARRCLECGQGLRASQRSPEFCSNGCRSSWNNRRLQRGAILYDLYMSFRFQRDIEGTFSLMARAASNFRTEDHKERGGRRSWRKSADVVQQSPCHFTARIGKR